MYTRRPAETVGSDALAELALDLRWSFNHAADTIWQRLDPVLWNRTHNPWFVLQTVSRARLDAVTADREFQQLVDGLVREKRDTEESPVPASRPSMNPPPTTISTTIGSGSQETSGPRP